MFSTRRRRSRKYISLALAVCVMCVGGVSGLDSQTPATFAQQIYAMKLLQSDLNTVGVMINNLSDQQIQQITRAGSTQGVRIIIGKVENPREISGVYRTMVNSEKIQVVWLPDPNDQMIMSSGFDFLRQNTIADRIGLYVPAADFVTNGALAAILLNGDNIEIHYNSRIAGRVGIELPGDDGSIKFIER